MKRYWFLSGMLAGFLYLLVDVIGGLRAEDYSFVERAVSELTQAGAEGVLGLKVTLFLFTVLGMVFWYTFSSKFRSNKKLRLAGKLLFVTGLMTALTGTVLPMDPIGAKATTAGILHLVLTGISAVIVLPLVPVIGIQLSKEIRWSLFKYYSFITVGVMIIFGGLTPVVIMKNITLMGLFERLNVYAYLLWVSVLSFKLCCSNKGSSNLV